MSFGGAGRKVILGLGAAATFGFGIYGGTLLSRTRDDPACEDCDGGVSAAKRKAAFSKVASTYDEDIGFSETITGITRMRRRLVGEATGKTLEMCVGTARNLEYYDHLKVTELTMVDNNLEMLEQAQSKIKSADERPKIVRLVQSENLAKFEDDCFDSVIDTFGMCSIENPEKVLEEMFRIVKPGGKVLLLEHGRSSSFDWLSRYLDKQAHAHATRWGCWWNRDILSMLEYCEKSIESKTVSIHHLGTCYEIVAIKKK